MLLTVVFSFCRFRFFSLKEGLFLSLPVLFLKRGLKGSVVFVCILCSFFTGAVFFPSSDVDYFAHSNSRFRLIFSENFLEEKDFVSLYERLFWYDQVYRNTFVTPLKDRPVYIFLSPRSQTTNAIAFSSPFLRVVFFPTGVEHLHRLGFVRWLDASAAHEMAHIYQWGQSPRALRFLKPFFKNSETIIIPLFLWSGFPVVVPLFLNPNVWMPRFFLEGHAVLHESLLAPGGRLYSGFARAFFLSQIKHHFQHTDQFLKEDLLNITLADSSMEQKYIQGGYFFAYLMKKYGLPGVQSIFKQHARYFMTPVAFISVRRVFQKTFHTSFESLVHGFVQEHLPRARKQKSDPAPRLFSSAVCPPPTTQGKEVFFLNSHFRGPPVLKILDLQTGQWREEKKNLKVGKVFRVQDRYYTSQEHVISSREKVSGLFSEGMYLLEKYKSHSVQDMQGERWLSISTKNNMVRFKLFLNGEFYATTHSPAVFGPQGGIYYFRQEQNRRVLYRNKAPLFGFKGFYGKPAWVRWDKGQPVVYFIGAVPLGSALFSWKKGEGFLRLSPSDVIVEAAPGPEGQILVCEIQAGSYHYKLIKPKTSSEEPVLYSYFFDDPLSPWQKRLASLKEGLSPSSVSSDMEYQGIPYTKYNSLREMGFGGLRYSFIQDPLRHYRAEMVAYFTDPLQYSQVGLRYGQSAEHGEGGVHYFHRKSLIDWKVEYSYRQGMDNLLEGSRVQAAVHRLGTEFQWPYLRKGYWSSSVGLNTAISHRSFVRKRASGFVFHVTPGFRLQYKRSYARGLNPYRLFALESSVEYISRLPRTESKFQWNFLSYKILGMGGEFYLLPFVHYRHTTHPKDLISFKVFRPGLFFDPISWSFFLKGHSVYDAGRVLRAGLQGEKSFDTPVYFSRLPVSLRRMAPQLKVQYVQWENHQGPHSCVEVSGGGTVELLLHHTVKARLAVYYGLRFESFWWGRPPTPRAGVQIQTLF